MFVRFQPTPDRHLPEPSGCSWLKAARHRLMDSPFAVVVQSASDG